MGLWRKIYQLRIVHGVIAIAGFLTVGFLVTLIAKQRGRLAAEVRRQRDAYERDMVLAAQVQRQVLPKPVTTPDLELAGAMQTARLLGGDYYDFFQISEDVIDVVIADVSGKGVAAALLMPSLAVALRLRARELNGPALADEHGDDAGGHEVGHGSGEHGSEAEAGEVVAAVGDEGSYAADLNADGAEVGEAAEREGGDGEAAGGESAFWAPRLV